ncbi:MAG TPA: hypothetical protein VHD60_01450 [Candidatus Saccharimonadales bacterium]|nr:hypothetical protein [Candidatus Saccharimonadales bacterium]
MRKVLHDDFWYLNQNQLTTMDKFCSEFVDPDPDSAPASFVGVVDVQQKPKLLLAIHERAGFAKDDAGRYSVATTDGDETCAWEAVSVHELPDHKCIVSVRGGNLLMSLTVFFDEEAIANVGWRDGPVCTTTTTPKAPNDFLHLEQAQTAA